MFGTLGHRTWIEEDINNSDPAGPQMWNRNLKTGCELGQLLVLPLSPLCTKCPSWFIDILGSLAKHGPGPLEEVDCSM